MTLFNFDISSSQSYDARLFIKDKICNQVLLKESISPRVESFTPYVLVISSTTNGNEDYVRFSDSLNKKSFSAITTEEGLTKMCMSISEQSLSEDWENENDDFWESFIND